MLRIENISKISASPAFSSVLAHLSFCLPEKGLFALIDDSFEERKTFFDILSGKEEASEGKIFWGRKEINRSKRRRKRAREEVIAFLSIEDTLHLSLSVKERVQGEKIKDSPIGLGDILRQAKLEGKEENPYSSLSVIERMRLELTLLALHPYPVVLITEGVYRSIEKTPECLKQLCDFGQNHLVLFSLPELSEDLSFLDGTILLRKGCPVKTEGKVLRNKKPAKRLSLLTVWKRMVARGEKGIVFPIISFLLSLFCFSLFLTVNVAGTDSGPERLWMAQTQNEISLGEVVRKADGAYLSEEDLQTLETNHPKIEKMPIFRYGIVFYSPSIKGIGKIDQRSMDRSILLYGSYPTKMGDFFVAESLAESLRKEQAKETMEALIGWGWKNNETAYRLVGIVKDMDWNPSILYFDEGWSQTKEDLVSLERQDCACHSCDILLSGKKEIDLPFIRDYFGQVSSNQQEKGCCFRSVLTSDFFDKSQGFSDASSPMFYISILGIGPLLLASEILMVILAYRKNRKEEEGFISLGYGTYETFRVNLLEVCFVELLSLPFAFLNTFWIVSVWNRGLQDSLYYLMPFGIGWQNVLVLFALVISLSLVSAALSLLGTRKR